MNQSRLVSVVVVVLTLAALGVAATTLETTLTTDPDDEINPNWEALPIDEQTAAAIQEEMQDEDPDQIETNTPAAEGADGGSSRPETEPDPGGDVPAIHAGEGPLIVTDPDQQPPPEPEQPLGPLLPLGLGLVVVLVAVGAVVYRAGIDKSDVASQSTTVSKPTVATPSRPTPTPESQTTAEWPDGEPTTVVDHAWIEMIQQLDLPQPETATPSECTARAREVEADQQAVEAVAAAFEAVQYGGQPASEQAARAEMGRDQLNGGTQ